MTDTGDVCQNCGEHWLHCKCNAFNPKPAPEGEGRAPDLGQADEIDMQYSKGDPTIDSGNLYYALGEYRLAFEQMRKERDEWRACAIREAQKSVEFFKEHDEFRREAGLFKSLLEIKSEECASVWKKMDERKAELAAANAEVKELKNVQLALSKNNLELGNEIERLRIELSAAANTEIQALKHELKMAMRPGLKVNIKEFTDPKHVARKVSEAISVHTNVDSQALGVPICVDDIRRRLNDPDETVGTVQDVRVLLQEIDRLRERSVLFSSIHTPESSTDE